LRADHPRFGVKIARRRTREGWPLKTKPQGTGGPDPGALLPRRRVANTRRR
jgi:hypothetical protein